MGTPIDQLIKNRKEKLAKIIKLGFNPSPPFYKKEQQIKNVKKIGLKANIAGRIIAYRRHGKLCFLDLKDETGKIQALTTANDLGEKTYAMIKLLDVGDFIGVQGEVFKTQAGEITIKAKAATFLQKGLYPLPDTWYGLKDTEERFRKRYIDLILNPEVKEVMDKRWKIERSIREFLWKENYQEVETPVLQSLYGGTNARPFTTHLNALDIDMYLRVAPELYLKRLIVGGYEKVFEIARNFRNEGVDLSHQPEFTMMEFYEAYADYHRIMDLTEALIQYVAKQTNDSFEIKVGENKIDLSGKWERITIDEALNKYLKIDWEKITDKKVKEIINKNKLKVPGVYTKNKALFVIFDHLVTDKLIQPTWVIDYPIDVSPLSKIHRSRPGRTERFEGYIGGKEICDGWSEIVNPVEQRERFEVEQKNLKAGDDEAQPLDEEFLEALSYGCPPLGGIGIGIDRLVMFITNTWSIKEVIPFPLMRPVKTREITTMAKANIKKSDTDKSSVSVDVKKMFPGMFYAYTIIEGVNIKKSDPELKKLTKKVIETNKIDLEKIGELKPIREYRQIFKKTGVWKLARRPSPEALLRRISLNKGIYNINTAVDAYNLAVIETGISLGGFNLDKVTLPVTLRLTKAGESMNLLGDDQPIQTLNGEIAYADSQKLLTLDLNYRDINETKITENTKRIILYADGAPGLSEKEVTSALEKGAKYIQQFCDGKISQIKIIK